MISTVSLLLNAVVLILLIGLYMRKMRKNQTSHTYDREFQTLERLLDKIERTTREEIATMRQEGITLAKANREELAISMERFSKASSTQLGESSIQQKHLLESFSSQLGALTQMNETKLEGIRASVETKIQSLQEDSHQKLEGLRASVEQKIKALQDENNKKLEEMRVESRSSAKENRDELVTLYGRFNQGVMEKIEHMAGQQKQVLESVSTQMNTLTSSNEKKLELVRSTVEERLKHIQEDNGQKLELMRVTVDEKLNSTLEQRLGQSFKLVSERLEQVHKSLGEMQTLANGVGDLKKVLTNVRNRGTLGEIQLQALLEQILSPDQFDMNVVTKPGSNDRVEFAIKIPSKDDMNTMVYLPIDSKFPLEDYQRLLDAHDVGDQALAGELSKQLEQRIRLEAKTIQSKYLSVPHTCDFAIMFLPLENLFGEVLRRPGLFEQIQRENRVIITGPTTLSAILNSLYMGLRTLAIQKHSSEVWQVLGAIKTEFGNFSTVLAKTKKKLQEASNQIENAQRNSRKIERKLRSVEDLSFPEQAKQILELEDLEDETELLAAE